MQQGYTHITFLLDSSSSMTKIASETIESFNNFLTDQKNAPGKCTFTFAKFSNDLTYISKFVDINNVRPLDIATFNPRGMTALNDAICKTVDETGNALSILHEDDKPAGVLFVILTDGEENCSFRFKVSDVKERIKHQEEQYNWKFIYLGANVDVQRETTLMGISNFNAFEATRQGVTTLYANLSTDTLTYRSAH